MDAPPSVPPVVQTAASAQFPVGEVARPIRLVVEARSGDRLSISVIGEGDRAFASRFSLIVEAGGNRSVQRSSASVEGGVRRTLSHVEVLAPRRHDWRVTLRVDGPPGYEMTERSAGG